MQCMGPTLRFVGRDLHRIPPFIAHSNAINLRGFQHGGRALKQCLAQRIVGVIEGRQTTWHAPTADSSCGRKFNREVGAVGLPSQTQKVTGSKKKKTSII